MLNTVLKIFQTFAGGFQKINIETPETYVSLSGQKTLKSQNNATFKSFFFNSRVRAMKRKTDMRTLTELPALTLMPDIQTNWIPIGY